MFKYRISVIVPIYNVEQYMKDCLDSLLEQTIDKKDLEVLLIVDGSPDNSEKICREYAEKYPFFKVFSKENEGLSKTRNYGVQRAQGKYLVYLDPDDKLTPNSLKNLANFFDKHEDEVDIVTYKIIPVFDGKQSEKLHYRYDYLQSEGVYDLTRQENIYISQTNVNICVKNEGENNTLFDVTENFKHEDQKYNLDIVRRKMKIGYCTGAQYLYTKNPNSITGTSFYAYYLFETTTAFWENLFAQYEGEVPQYIQALYINDINWKSHMDILLPYHYDDEKFKQATDRLVELLKRVDDYVIINHPKVEPPHKTFLIDLKEKGSLNVVAGDGGVGILKENKPVFFEKFIPFSLCKFRVTDKDIFIDAFLRSPIFSFVDKPEVTMHLTGANETVDIPVELENSAWDYYHTKIKTNKFWRIRVNWDYKKYRSLFFTVKVGDTQVAVKNEFINGAPFDKLTERTSLFRKGYEFVQLENGFVSRKASEARKKAYYKKYDFSMMLHKPRTFLWRLACGNKISPDRRIWLYYDCRNVFKDNGYYQFNHDFNMNDGIERYYVVRDKLDRSSILTPKQRKNVVKFGSLKHRKLLFAAEKIVTAFAEYENISPFIKGTWPYYTDLFKAEVVYLQHGVLHAFLPWKYSSDRVNIIDREVISTSFEMKNMTENYGFRKEDLIPTGMPRYDFIEENAAKVEKKILFGPTWRKYLIGANTDGTFFATPDKFKKSDFFKETYAFLHSEELENCLKENGWVLDFKLHPIFADYASLYELDGKYIRIADRSVDEKSYKVFITDFSSYCFDFVYLKKTLMYFVPDDEMFRAGMNDYRKLDLPLEEGFGPLAHSADEAVAAVKGIVANNGEPAEIYKERMDGFFLNKGKNCCDEIYKALIQE